MFDPVIQFEKCNYLDIVCFLLNYSYILYIDYTLY